MFTSPPSLNAPPPKRKIFLILGGVLLLVLVLFLFFNRKHTPKDPVPESESLPEAALPEGASQTFPDLQNVTVVAQETPGRFAFLFVFDRAVVGEVEFSEAQDVEHIFSYDSGSEYFGFTPRDAEIGFTYGGPTVLYRLKPKDQTFEKVIDLSQHEHDVFITDISVQETQVVYASHDDARTIWIQDLRTGEIKNFPVDGKVGEFGDALLSEDGTRLAYASLTETSSDPAQGDQALAQILVMDVESKEVQVLEKQTGSGVYHLYRWEGSKLDYTYDVRDEEETEE